MYRARMLVTVLLCFAAISGAWSQQLKLGKQPYSMVKSALLELNTDNQGLLMPRISDTSSINTLSPPDGMTIYFTPLKRILIRSNGSWQQVMVSDNITNASPTTPGAATIGVDANGKVVRVKAPVYYSGTGASASTETVTKVWMAEVSNNSSGAFTVTIPSNVAFTNILNIQVTAKGGNSVATAPLANVTSNTTSSVTIRVLKNKTTSILIGGTADGLEACTDTSVTIYIRVEGN